MAKNTKNPGAIDKERPAWLQNIIDGLKVIFLTPVALIARIAQRIALGKEGAQRADEEAKADEVTRRERAGHEKNAKRMGEEIQNIVEKDKDSIFKNVDIYVPDQSVNGLHYAINVELKNGTRYRDAQDFSLYIDGDNNIVCNDMVPDEVVKHLQELLQRTQLKVRNVQPDTPNQDGQDEQSNDKNNEGKDAPKNEELNNDGTDEPAPDNEPAKEDVVIEGEVDGQAFTLKRPMDGSLAELNYNGQTYTVNYNNAMHAITIEPQSEDALTKDLSDNAKTAFAKAAASIYQDEITAFHDECVVDENSGYPRNGGTCELMAAAGVTHKLPQDALFVIPDALHNDLVVMQVTPNSKQNGYSISTGIIPSTGENEFGDLQYVVNKKGEVDSKNIRYVTNEAEQAKSNPVVSIKLAKSYLDAVATVHPDYNILVGNTIYQNLDAKNPQAMATYKPHEGFVTAHIPKSATRPSNEQMADIAAIYDSVNGLADPAKIAQALQDNKLCVIADGIVFEYDAEQAFVIGYLAGTDKEFSEPTHGGEDTLENGVKSIFAQAQAAREQEVIVEDTTPDVSEKYEDFTNQVAVQAHQLVNTATEYPAYADPMVASDWKQKIGEHIPDTPEHRGVNNRFVDYCLTQPKGTEMLKAALQTTTMLHTCSKAELESYMESQSFETRVAVASFLVAENHMDKVVEMRRENERALEEAHDERDSDVNVDEHDEENALEALNNDETDRGDD